MANRTGLSVDEYRLLEQEPSEVPNQAWTRLLAGMAIIDAVLGGNARPGLAPVTSLICRRIEALMALEAADQTLEIQRIQLELAWIDDGGQ
jgi:hypothetical protein